jgi:hypothetical protein
MDMHYAALFSSFRAFAVNDYYFLQLDTLTYVSNELFEMYSAKYTQNHGMISQRWLITCSLGIYGYS